MSAQPHSVLVVDDDGAMREMLASLLEEHGYRVDGSSSADAALEKLRDAEYDAVLSDIRMPGRSGIELVGACREVRPDTPVILMTAFGSIDSAVAAMRSGAADYITKPFQRDAVLVALDRAIERRALEEENRRLRRAVDRTSAFGDLIGQSEPMREVFALIRRVAGTRSSVLITGESGTGKEVVARTLHFCGPRAKNAFVPINCTAIPEGLLESELFGHVRGAFTGAHTTKRGLFEKADGGTLFLDEIGDMGLGLQSKLLRVLQDREIRPVGGTQSVKVDVRIIAATHQDLSAAIEAGRFRSDLYYRLNVIPIHIPPLRERPEDIPLLAEAFLRKHADDRPRSLSAAAVDRLKRFAWPGNARELENVIERALALSDRPEIGAHELPLPGPAQAAEPSASAGVEPRVCSGTEDLLRGAVEGRLSLAQLENLYIEEVLKYTRGNKVQAARILGINRRTLYRRGERQRRPTELAEA
jgi:DNA-binding NtrC family response regulator